MNILGIDVQDALAGAALALFVLFTKWAGAAAIRRWFGSKEPG